MSWLVRATELLAAKSGCDAESIALDPADVEALLDASRVAAHDSGDRINAPLVCALIGRAAEAGNARVADLAHVIEGMGEPQE